VNVRNLAALTAVAAAASLVAAGGSFSNRGATVTGLLLALLASTLLAPTFRSDRLERTLGLFLAWSAVSAILVSPNYLASKQTVGMWAAAALLFALVRRAAPSSRHKLLTILSATAFLVSAGVVWVGPFQGSPFSGGVFENPNLTAAVLVALLPLVATSPSPMLRFGGTPFLILALGLTGSRAGLAALVVVILLLLPGRARWIGGVLAGTAGTAVIWWRLATHPDPLAWFRLEIWGAILRLFAQHPLTGVSPGGLYDASGAVRLTTTIGCSLHARHMAGAESSVLGILVSTGAVGALLAVAIAVLAIVALHRSLDGPELRAGLAALAGCLVLATFHDYLQEPGVLWWWAVVAGLLVPRSSEDASTDRSTALAVLRGTVAAGVMAWTTLQPSLARWITASSPSPETAALRMLRLEPWNDRPARAVVTRALSQEGRWSWETAGKALFWSEHVVTVHPGAAPAWALSGRVNARLVTDLGAYPSSIFGAREGFQEACRLEPHLPWYWIDWATFERQMGQLEPARRLASRAVTEEPNCVRAWLLLARIDLDSGQVEMARRDLEAARKARDCFRGRVLEAYERDLLWAPPWQWRQLEEALP